MGFNFVEDSQVADLGVNELKINSDIEEKTMSGVHGCLLEVTVVKCKHLKHTGFESNQEHPYVCIEYGSSRYHSRKFQDGDPNFVFQEKFVFTLSEGSREIAISVYNSNTVNEDGFIGKGRVQLQRVISQGYDKTTWPIFSENGRITGEVCLMLCCPTIKSSAFHYQQIASNYTQSYTVGDYLPRNNRGLKRPLLFENNGKNEEELSSNLIRRKLTTESEDIAMDEVMDRTSPTTALDEDTEMACGSQLPSQPYSTMWNTICF